MLTDKQRKEYLSAFRTYKRKYLVEKYMELDESATRMMINSFLCDVLGYVELDEIKTEYAIKGTYADYVIQLENTQHKLVFNYDLTDDIQYKKAEKDFVFLTKKSVSKGELDTMWNRHVSIVPQNMCRHLYTMESIKLMKRMLKRESGINFTEEDIHDAIHKIVTTKIEIDKPKLKA